MKNKILVAMVAMFVMITVQLCQADQVSLMAENDFLFHTDSYFTHGTRLQYLQDDNLGYALGQNMYTPRDKKSYKLIPDDRPYAGYLYSSLFYTEYDKKSENYSEIQVGVVGPDSMAEETQNFIHSHIGSALANGWSNQIPNHFACTFIDKYFFYTTDSKYFAVDPYLGFAVGSVQDYPMAGILGYLGYNLPKDRNNNRTIILKTKQINGWNPYAYIYSGVESKYMAFNVFLNDDRFDITQEEMVYDYNFGAVLGCKYCEFAMTVLIRTKEFREQESEEKYGGAKITVRF